MLNTLRTLCMLCLLVLLNQLAYAGIEPYQNFLKGSIKAGDSLIVKDEKFRNAAFNWADITNISVQNALTLRVVDEQSISQSFSVRLKLRVEYFSSPEQTEATRIDSVALNVNYSKEAGATYKNIDTYTFTNGYYVKVQVLSVSSPEYGSSLPPVLQLSSMITIDRKYAFKPFLFLGINGQAASAGTQTKSRLSSGTTTNSNNQLALSWQLLTGAEEYDIEWVTVDEGSEWESMASDLHTNTGNIPDDQIATLFRNNATRVTTHENNYTISLLYSAKYILVRMRQVQYTTDGLRNEGSWFYKQDDNSTYAVWTLNWHEPQLNWQYSAAYAEEGKKKEVVSYFDGTLRGRQTVTLNNSDNVAVVQENVYDQFGRAAASILPAPVKENLATQYLHYFPSFNKNGSNIPYSYADLNAANCEPLPSPLSNVSGASKYYSGQNQFINDNLFNKYIPDAEGYPLSVTQYTPDNTGRIKLQGGVGPVFQPGKADKRSTRYYYSKPEQWELDRMFGSDVGYAEHYLKNMVVDPNGQISISYLNAAGKTIATALTGNVPANLDSLKSKPQVSQVDMKILRPEQFKFNASALTLSATTTYTASVMGPATLKYNIEKLISKYPGGAFQPCSNCYYELSITVRDDCNNPVYTSSSPVKIGSDSTNCEDTGIKTDSISTNFSQIGEYYITFEFALSKKVIDRFTEDYISQGQANGTLKKQADFVLNRLAESNFSDSFTDCKTALSKLGGKEAFTAMFKGKLSTLGDSSNVYDSYISGLYDNLHSTATALVASCDTLSASGASSPCEVYRTPMLADVSPGGQYALTDSLGNLLEPAINVLQLYFKHGAFDNLTASDPLYQSSLITLDNGQIISPYDAAFSLQNLIKYWQPEWAEQFLSYHPEYCKLQFCNQNTASARWDEKLRETEKESELPAILNGSRYNRAEPAWLLAHDPFFQPGAAGYAYRDSLAADLSQYSTRILKLNGPSVKSITQLVDYQLYCSDTSGTTNQSTDPNNWDNCIPVEACRVINQEWESYRDMYLDLKVLYFQKARKDSACVQACPVGKTTEMPADSNDFTDCNYDGPTVNSDKAVALQQLSSVIRANTSNAIEMWLHSNTAGSRQFIAASPDMKTMMQACVNGNLLSVDVFSLSQDAPDNVHINLTNHVTADISSILPLKPWTHLVVQGADLARGSLEIWVNGKKYTPVAGAPAAGCPWAITSSPLTMPENFSRLQHLRLYSGRLMAPIEIKVNAASKCFMASDHAAMSWYRFNAEEVIASEQPTSGSYVTESGLTCTHTYQVKTTRFLEISTNNLTRTDPDELKDQHDVSLYSQIANSAHSMADGWIQRLQPGLDQGNYPAETVALLREKLIELSSKAGDLGHPFGASSLPAGQSILVGITPCSTFGDVIKQVLNLSQFTNELNPWLLDAPYPYEVKQQSNEIYIAATNSELVNKLNSLRPEGYDDNAFFTHLQSSYGTAMTLSQADFNTLLKGCTNCRYLLDYSIKLPVFLQPGNTGCISRSGYDAAISELHTAFNNAIDSTWSNYETIAANFVNHKYGFTLSYNQYRDFASGSQQQLCNEPPFTSLEEDPYAGVKAIIEVAYGAASQDYDHYIAEERTKFVNAYINTCAAAKASVQLQAQQQIYHYTLYYYDMAGNLLRTIPPEGVSFLTEEEIVQVQNRRENVQQACNYDGPETVSDRNTALQSLSDVLQDTGSNAVEMWLQADATTGSRQFISTTPDMKYMLQACINGNLVNVDIFTLEQTAPDNVNITRSNHVTANISDMLPLAAWTHLVVQGSNLGQGDLQIWVNGKSYMPVAGAPSAGCGWAVSSNPLNMPNKFTLLKHLRTYSGRLMEQGEIAANAASSCFTAADHTSMAWYRFNLPPAGGGSLAETNTDTTQYIGRYPQHTLATTYAYNSTNQVVQQHTPDGGTSKFWYDKLSRLIISQNAKQAAENNYSYTKYDVLGRIVEVGQKNTANSNLSEPGFLEDGAYAAFLAQGSNSQLTQTLYDEQPAAGNGIPAGLIQNNLRKRVAASIYRETPNSTAINASYYNYDVAGNVKNLYQQVNGLGVKQLSYEYDLVSGKVNFLAYQHGKNDQFYYQYKYDAENRLRESWTGTQASISPYGFGSTLTDPYRRMDASYQYYLHGPLARLELGDQNNKVQGLDYAYTLQGWLKGVNGSALDANGAGNDIGQDFAVIAKDAYAFSLGYYTGDYKPIGGTGYTAFAHSYQGSGGDITGRSLYNGNISNSTYALSKINNGATTGYSYNYDQLNRLTNLRQHSLSSAGNWGSSSMTGKFKEDFRYDGNGNILSLLRHNQNGQAMDQLSYTYNRDANGQLTNNRLAAVSDAVGVTDSTDIGSSSYTYDAIGNLISDAAEGITNIDWSVYGKIRQINKASGNISYSYDPAGHRVSKTTSGLTTYYVRDAQGNSLGVYEIPPSGGQGVIWQEQQLYGSSRLGMWRPKLNLDSATGSSIWNTGGLKFFELNNHLGNVMAVISNNRLQLSGGYEADVINAQEYYAGGMQMPGRSFSLGSYRYGFNGKEKDDEIKGGGNSLDFGARIYDPRLGRFLSTDPLSIKYPSISPYTFVLNNPINAVDPDGRDVIFVNGFRFGFSRSRDANFQDKLMKSYWNSVNPNFTGNVNKYFNDYKNHFVNASHRYGSEASQRQGEGYQLGIKMVTSGEIKISAENNVMTIVMHSQGNAEGVGLAGGIIDEAKRQGKDVKVNLVFLSVHQPDDIKMSDDLKKRGIQFTYANDNAKIVDPMGKISGVEDANSDNASWKKDGLGAHSATVDDKAAFETIKKTDKEKKIYIIKPKKK